MEKLVAIIDVMPEYGRRLAVYLNGSRTFPYRAVVFSSANEVEGYIKNDGVYAVVAAEELEKAVLEVTVGTKVKLFWLGESKDGYRPSLLYRYGSVKEIERRLTEERSRKKHVPVIGYFSPVGGSEAELLSRKIAEEIGKRGKVLYIPMFPVGIYGRQSGDGLSELLYFLRQAEAVRNLDLQRLLQRGEYMDSIGPVRWFADLCGVTKEDMEGLLRSDMWDTEYQAYFVAVGQFDNVGKTILNCCDAVLMPVWETADGTAIAEEFRRQLKESGETKLYSALLEFSVKEPSGMLLEEAVAAAVKKGGEILAGNSGRNTETNVGEAGFVGGFDR